MVALARLALMKSAASLEDAANSFDRAVASARWLSARAPFQSPRCGLAAWGIGVIHGSLCGTTAMP